MNYPSNNFYKDSFVENKPVLSMVANGIQHPGPTRGVGWSHILPGRIHAFRKIAEQYGSPGVYNTQAQQVKVV